MAELDRAKLQGTDLRNAIMNGASLRAAVATRANLTNAQLKEADLRGASLAHANLKHASLQAAHLENVDLSNACLASANLRGAYLPEAILYEAGIEAADLSGANLKDADLRWVRVVDADLLNADLMGSDLRAVNLSASCNLTDGQLLGARTNIRALLPMTLPRPTRMMLRQILASHQEWVVTEGRVGEQAVLKQRNLSRMDFTGADLGHAILSGVRILSASLRWADLDTAKMMGCHYTDWLRLVSMPEDHSWSFRSAPPRVPADVRGASLVGAVSAP
jgi:uncharacterized protein YjbI with pentapeptide repeats